MRPIHISLICRSSGTGVDGIRDHTAMLADALGDIDGVTATMHDLRGARELAPLRSSEPTNDYEHAVVVQYNPFSYGRRGWATWLVRELRRLRSQRPDTTVVMLAHELFVGWGGPTQMVLGLAQRAQFAALRQYCDVIITTVEPLAHRAGGFRRPPADVLPVGSNLPDRRSARAHSRRTLGLEDGQLVLGLLGTNHWTRMFDVLVPTVDKLAAGRRLVVLNLGAGAPTLRILSEAQIHTSGELAVADLAERLAAVDLLLLPFVDGVSTRRTTMMAALQHAIPVVSTDGPSTSDLLRTSAALALVPVEQVRDEFAQRAESLLEDAPKRLAMARAARELYDSRFAWPVLAGQLIDIIERTKRANRSVS